MIKYIFVQQSHSGKRAAVRSFSASLRLPAFPSRLMGQLEPYQPSRLFHGSLPLAMKFLVESHMLTDTAKQAEIGGSLEMKLVLSSAQLLTGDLGKQQGQILTAQ